MSSYPPPQENVPVFDAGLFRSAGGDPLSEEYLRTVFLQYPIAQTGLETLSETKTTGQSEFNGTMTNTSAIPYPDNSTTVPTTAWVNLAVAGGSSPNLLPLNNTWTGTNQFTLGTNMSDNLTMNSLVQSNKRQIFASYYNLYDINVFGALSQTGRFYSAQNSIVYDCPTNTTTSSHIFYCYSAPATAVNVLQISTAEVTNSTMAGVASTNSSTKVPTTAWVQSAITGSVGGTNMWNYQINNVNTSVTSGTGSQVANLYVPYSSNNQFASSIRLEISYSIFINATNTLIPSWGLIPAVDNHALSNPNTLTIIDLIFDPATASYFPVVTQSTFVNVLQSGYYLPPNSGVALNYTPVSFASTTNYLGSGFNQIRCGINFPRVQYLASSYQGNLLCASASIRIVSSQGAATSVASIKGGASAGVAYFA